MSKIGLSEESSDKSEMIDSIGHLVGESFNIAKISNYGYKEPQNADVAWQIGNSVKSSTTISYDEYGALMDLDNNPTPFKGMDVTGRIGGDEFMVFMHNIRVPENAAILADKVQKLVMHSFDGEDFGNDVSMSIGISIAPKDGIDFKELYDKADKALYFVKTNGKASHRIYDESLA